ncbi:MAG: nitroreductase family protein [Peptococcaceae bacterium]|nr:nitroreductase family protein [Peptococcaceae bacterium]
MVEVLDKLDDSLEQGPIENWNETEKVILTRRSVRLYKNKQVPEELVKRILEAGRFAPSAGNFQPWKFVVVRDPKVLNFLEEATIGACQKIVEMVGDSKPPQPVHPFPASATRQIANREFGVLHGAPTAILIFKDVRGLHSPDLDCGIAGQNMVIAASSLGLGTCWVNFLHVAFEFVPQVKEFFGIEYPFEFLTSIAVGYPKGNPFGMVDRETHAVEWYENDSKYVIY